MVEVIRANGIYSSPIVKTYGLRLTAKIAWSFADATVPNKVLLSDRYAKESRKVPESWDECPSRYRPVSAAGVDVPGAGSGTSL
jgi:hypothetical protein